MSKKTTTAEFFQSRFGKRYKETLAHLFECTRPTIDNRMRRKDFTMKEIAIMREETGMSADDLIDTITILKPIK